MVSNPDRNNSLDLEKQRIGDRLEALERTVSNYMSITELRMKNQEVTLEKLNHIIVGNGNPGIAEKVRKLEDLSNQVKAIWIAMIVFGANLAKDWWLKINT